MNAVLIEGGEGFRALLTQNTLTIHDAHGGRAIVTGPDLETLVQVLTARGVKQWPSSGQSKCHSGATPL